MFHMEGLRYELTCPTAVRTCSSSSSFEIRLRTMLFFKQYLLTVLSLNPFSPGYICFNMSLISTWVFFWWRNKSRIKSTSVASMFEFGANLFPGCRNIHGHSCHGSAIVDKDRYTVRSPRLLSPSLPSPKPALQGQPSLKPSLPDWVHLCPTLISRVSIFNKNKNQKLKSIFNFGFWSINFRLSTGKTNDITINFLVLFVKAN